MSLRTGTTHRRPLAAALLTVLALIAIGCSKSSTTEQTGTPAVSSPPAAVSPTEASPASSPPATAGELSGTWSGTYSGTFNGTFTLKWSQTGPALKGTIDLSTAGTVPINGAVTGNTIAFGTVGSTAITYTGTVSGDSMSGTYHVAGGGSGDWSATRTA